MNRLLLSITAAFLMLPFIYGQTKTFEIDGINYSIISEENHTVSVAKNTDFVGEAIIPQSITYESTTYTVTNISATSFYNCANLTSVTIPESIITIGSKAFNYCRRLKRINIASMEDAIEVYKTPFYGCDSVTTIYVNCPSIGVWLGDFSLLKELNFGNRVREIGRSSCCGLINLPSISLPEGLKTIGPYAFTSCSSLPSIVIPESTDSIGDEAFKNCSSLSSVRLPNIKHFGDAVFSNCALKSIYLGKGFTADFLIFNSRKHYDWSYSSFYGKLGEIESIIVENDNPKYDSRENCNAIIDKNVLILGCDNTIIPQGVSTIGKHAFLGAMKMVSLVIPEGVTDIEEDAFINCIGLESVELPNSLQVSNSNFGSEKNIKTVISHIVSPPPFSSNKYPVGLDCTLVIPAGTRLKYIEKGWTQHYANVIEMEEGEPIWLSIKDALNGSTDLKCVTGEKYTFRFTPIANWHVHSVVFNGEDVTSQLTAENEFTTPAMAESATLTITYAQGSNAVKASQAESTRVVKVNDEIIVKNAPKSTPIQLYSLSGHHLKSVPSAGNETRINVKDFAEGMLIVNVGDLSVKVMLQ